MPVESNHSPYHQNGQNGHSPAPLIISPTVAMRNGAAIAGVTPPPDEPELTQALRIIRRRKGVIAGVAIAVTSAIWAWTLAQTPIYRSEFRVLVESVTETDRSQALLSTTEGQIGASSFDYETQIEVLRSPALLKPVVDRLQKNYPEINYGSLAGNLVITRLRDTKVLSVSYLDPNPDKVKLVLDELAQAYLRYSFEQRQTSLRQGVQFVEDQLPELRERVNSLQLRLEGFRRQHTLIDPQTRGSDISSLMSQVEKQRQETQTQLTEARSLYSSLQGQLGYSPEEALAASSLSESPRYQALLNQIREIETKIAEELARFQPGSPMILALEDQRNNLLPLLEQEAGRILGDRLVNSADGNLTGISLDLSRQLVNTANQVQVLQSRSEALAAVESRLKSEFGLVPGLARQYTDLQRELTIATDSLNRFLATRESLQIEAAQKSIPWELMSNPAVPGAPIAPRVPRNFALGAIAGLLLGAAAALIAEKLDNVFHSPEELKTITKLPLLGVIPYVKELRDKPAPVPAASVALRGNARQSDFTTTQAALQTPFFEAFRSFYANLRFLGTDTPIRSIVISSAAPSEGKSTTAVHLAKAAAAMGQRVLLVDADLRCPQVHSRLGVPNLRGLTNILANEMQPQQMIQRSPQDDNLYVLTAGLIPPDPIKLLSSRKMHALMQQLQSQFDLTIYDMPPLLGFADASLLAAQTDGMVLVVGLGKTERSSLTQAIDTLRISPISILGIVANGIRSYTTHTYHYYQYYKHYQRHGASPHDETLLGQVRQLMQPRSPQAEAKPQPSPRLQLLLLAGIGITTFLIGFSWVMYQRLVSPPRPTPTSQVAATQPSRPSETASPTIQDPFTQAIELAEQAVAAGKTAQTQADWLTIANQWEQAADWMAIVPTQDQRYATAQDRANLYRRHSEAARKQAEEAIVR